MASGYRSDSPGGSGAPNQNTGGNISLDYGPADPHSKRSISFEAMQDPGVSEGIGATAAKGPFKGPQDQKGS
jgi:hypothetical protein